MKELRIFFKECGLVAAATIGAGIFALPYIFTTAGWLLSILYLGVFSVILILAHFIYFRVLENTGEKHRLLGLIREYFGRAGFYAGILIVIGGLLLALVIHLILGSVFIGLLFPRTSPYLTLLGFWAVCSVPLIIKARRSMTLENLGVICISVVIFFIFLTAHPVGALNDIKLINLKNFALPFGAVLFALAGWTAIEPLYSVEKNSKNEIGSSFRPYLALAAGTFISALLYLMFSVGILSSSALITPNTISGLVGWPTFKLWLVCALGLLALWTSYMPISIEIKNSLEHDLGWKKFLSIGAVIILPLLFVVLGLNNFLKVIGLVGGVFLGLQYLFIALIGERVLRPTGVKKFLFSLASFVFVLGAIYEVYYFVLK